MGSQPTRRHGDVGSGARGEERGGWDERGDGMRGGMGPSRTSILIEEAKEIALGLERDEHEGHDVGMVQLLQTAH